jgi:outer membrane protein/protease secretion system outer membrane protein
MTHLKKTVLCAMLFCGSGVAWSINLSQSYEAALGQDATIRAARANAEAGREVLPQAKAQLLPTLSASFGANSNRLSSTSPDYLGKNATTDSSYPSHNETLTLRQPIYRKYLLDNYRLAQVVVKDVDASLAVEVQNLAVRVGTAYFDALLAEEQHALVKAQLANYTVQLEAARKLFKGGSGTRTDIDEVQSRVDMNLAQELETRQHIQFTRRQLQVFVNQAVDNLAALDPAKLVLAQPEPDRLEYWTDLAERSSPELAALRARVEAAELDVEKAKAGHTPTLDAVAQWSRSASENTFNTQSSTDLQTLGLQLTIPIYSGGGVSSAVRQAQAVKERFTQMLEASRRDLGVRVQREFRGVTEGVLRVKALEQAVRSTQQAVQSSEKSFQAGARTRIDVLNAENNKMTASRDLAQARFGYMLSQLRLKALVNEADARTIEVLNQQLK